MKRYLANRNTNTILKYGLLRRTEVVIDQLRRFCPPKPCTVLDIGTADGLMLRSLAECFGWSRWIGIGVDTRFHYLKTAKESVPHVVQADGRRLSFCTNSVDVIISTAVFKHIRGLESLLLECRRVLRAGGKLIATDPTPLGIRVGLRCGHFVSEEIVQTLTLRDTERMLTRCGFQVINAERFMLSPVPFVGCDMIEKALKRAHLDQMFFDQVICAGALPIEPNTC